MATLISLDTALKLKKLGVNQKAEYYYVWNYLIVDYEIYRAMNAESPEQLEQLEIIGTNIEGKNIHAIRYDDFSLEEIHYSFIPKYHIDKVAAFGLEELILLNAENITIKYDAENLAEFVAEKYIENLEEVNQIFD